MHCVTLIHQTVHQPIPVIGGFNHDTLQTGFKSTKYLENIFNPVIVPLAVEPFVF